MSKVMSTRDAFGDVLLKLGEERKDIVVVDADISDSTRTYKFHKRFPNRSFNLGVAEQNMMGVAAGLATTGKVVFASTYAVFASMRACEQVRTFIAYPHLNAKICASHGGLHVGQDGGTHQGIEDIAIMRAIPNMVVIQPTDAVSTEKAVRVAAEYVGPVYIRLIRNEVPILFDESYKFVLGKANLLEDSGSDVAILATGVMVSRSLEAQKTLLDKGIRAKIIEVHTIKPIDEEMIVKVAKECGAIVTAEDHNIIGGLGSAVAEVLVENAPIPMERIGIRDMFGESGDPNTLLDAYGMGIKDIVEACERVVQRKRRREVHGRS